MPVIINELEIVTEAPTESAAAAAEGEAAQGAAQPAGAPALSPADVESVVCFQAERASRLYAG